MKGRSASTMPTTTTTTTTSSSSSSASLDKGVQVYTLYLLRHGEAAHNVLEKEARKEAKESAMAEGYAPDSEECLRRMEEARRDVLGDDTLLDSPLTDRGKEQARHAAEVVKALQASKGLPEPTEVLVSPLQRALQTADLVFPNCRNIHVRLELQERQTGKPCDTRQPASTMLRRKTFQNFSFGRLSEADRKEVLDTIQETSATQLSELLLKPVRTVQNAVNKRRQPVLDGTQVEEKEKVRERARKVFDLLAESDHRVVCVVTHKGYLRELERGHLGQPSATEFDNCEVRVYRVSIDKSSTTNMPCDVQRLEPPPLHPAA
jgi:broad specificity phosphatase PhoE